MFGSYRNCVLVLVVALVGLSGFASPASADIVEDEVLWKVDHADELEELAMSGDGHYLAAAWYAGGYEIYVEMLEIGGDGSPTWTYNWPHSAWNTQLAADHLGGKFVVGSDDQLKVFSALSSSPLYTHQFSDFNRASDVTVASRGGLYSGISESSEMLVYDGLGQANPNTFPYIYVLKAVGASADGRRLGAVQINQNDEGVDIWDAQTGASLYSDGIYVVAERLTFSADGTYCAFQSDDDEVTVLVFNGSTYQNHHRFILSGHIVNDCAISENGSTLVIGTFKVGRGAVALYDVPTMTELWLDDRYNNPVVSVDISADGSRVVAGSTDPDWDSYYRVSVYDRASDLPIHALTDAGSGIGPVEVVQISDNGQRVVASGVVGSTNDHWLLAMEVDPPKEIEILAFNGLETGDFTEAVNHHGTVTVETYIKRSGNYGMRMVGDLYETCGYAIWKAEDNDETWVPFDLDKVYLTCHYKKKGSDILTTAEPFLTLEDLNGPMLSLRHTDDSIEVYDRDNNLLGSAVDTSFGEPWERVDLLCRAESVPGLGDGFLEIRVGRDPVIIVSGYPIGSSLIRAAILGRSTNISGDPFHELFDDIIVTTNGWIEDDLQIAMLYPNADGTYNSWYSWGSGWHYQLDDFGDGPPQGHDGDASFVKNLFGGMDGKLTVEVASPSSSGIPWNATIHAAMPLAVLREQQGITRMRMFTISNSVEMEGPSNVDPTFEYRPMLHVFEKDFGNGNQPWTVSALEDVEVGLIDHTISYHDLRCTALGLNVLYSGTSKSGFGLNDPDVPFGPRVSPEQMQIGFRMVGPNPFASTSVINFATPGDRHVALKVFDLHGRLVRTIVDGTLAGDLHQYTWDGRDSQGELAPSGIYFYHLDTGDREDVKRIVLAR